MKHPRFYLVAFLCLVLFVAISLDKKADSPCIHYLGRMGCTPYFSTE